MSSSPHQKHFVAAWCATSILFFASIGHSAQTQGEKPSTDTTSMTVIVKDNESGQPVPQAHITLEFFEPHGPTIPRKPKKISYNAKTDMDGRCKLVGINKGPIVLTVIEPGHQTYGKEFQLEKDNQVFEVRLKKPQPLL